ncbi:MAG: RNase adapter RapZ [Ilumatobacteraceae bacterium]
MTDVLVITGLSGAGRSQAADVLEDLGWFVVDNLPIELLDKIVELGSGPGSFSRLGLVVSPTAAPAEVLEHRPPPGCITACACCSSTPPPPNS